MAAGRKASRTLISASALRTISMAGAPGSPRLPRQGLDSFCTMLALRPHPGRDPLLSIPHLADGCDAMRTRPFGHTSPISQRIFRACSSLALVSIFSLYLADANAFIHPSTGRAGRESLPVHAAFGIRGGCAGSPHEGHTRRTAPSAGSRFIQACESQPGQHPFSQAARNKALPGEVEPSRTQVVRRPSRSLSRASISPAAGILGSAPATADVVAVGIKILDGMRQAPQASPLFQACQQVPAVRLHKSRLARKAIAVEMISVA